MDIQYLIVILILLAAFSFAGRSIYRRTRSFTSKPGCDSDCGCGTTSKKI